MLRGRIEGNPAEHPGVTIYNPVHDESFAYLPDTGQVVDTKTGDKFAMSSVHGNTPAQFGVVNSSNKVLVQGSYYVSGFWLAGARVTVYDIVATGIYEQKKITRKPVDYDAGRLASFFKAQADSQIPSRPPQVIVADSRHARGYLPE